MAGALALAERVARPRHLPAHPAPDPQRPLTRMKRGWLSPLSTVRKLFRSSVNAGNQLENRSAHHPEISEGNKVMRVSGEIILEKARRYRATASLYRQTAAFRPLQKWSLLEQAERWDRLAVAELEDYFNFNSPDYDEELHVTPYANERCEMVAAA